MGIYEHKIKTSKPFMYFWESLKTSNKGGRQRARYVLKPVNEYGKHAKKILEIGCGPGEVLVNLPKKYAIYGLDITKDYIEVCKRKIPRGKFSFPACITSKSPRSLTSYSPQTMQSTF